eukprot:8284267-Pyramimonas_sp.AAC.1
MAGRGGGARGAARGGGGRGGSGGGRRGGGQPGVGDSSGGGPKAWDCPKCGAKNNWGSRHMCRDCGYDLWERGFGASSWWSG